MQINRFVMFLVSLTVSFLASCYTVTNYENWLLTEFKPPEGVDNVAGTALAFVFLGLILFTFHSFTHILLLILCFTRWRHQEIFISDIFIKREFWLLNAIRIAGYAVVILLARAYIMSGLNYTNAYVLSMLNILIYVLWGVSILKSRGA